MIPEQVWDGRPPGPAARGRGTFSATPLAWSHAQLVRLAWSIDAGAPVEQPSVVACRYVRRARPRCCAILFADLAPVRGFPSPGAS